MFVEDHWCWLVQCWRGFTPSRRAEPCYVHTQKYFLHLARCHNEIDSGWGASRFFVFQVGEKHLNDKAWFAKVAEELRTTGYAGFLHSMLNSDISKFQVEEVLQREWLTKQK